MCPQLCCVALPVAVTAINELRKAGNFVWNRFCLIKVKYEKFYGAFYLRERVFCRVNTQGHVSLVPLHCMQWNKLGEGWNREGDLSGQREVKTFTIFLNAFKDKIHSCCYCFQPCTQNTWIYLHSVWLGNEKNKIRTHFITYFSCCFQVKELRNWAKSGDKLMTRIRLSLSRINPGDYFDLVCQVVAKSYVSRESCVYLKVWDGTKCRL